MVEVEIHLKWDFYLFFSCLFYWARYYLLNNDIGGLIRCTQNSDDFFFYMQFLIYNLNSFTRVPDLVIFLLNDTICYFIILHSYGISVGDI